MPLELPESQIADLLEYVRVFRDAPHLATPADWDNLIGVLQNAICDHQFETKDQAVVCRKCGYAQ